MSDLPQMLTVTEVANVLRCSKDHVRRLVRRGMLRSLRVVSPDSRVITKQSRRLIFVDSVFDYLELEKVKPCRTPKALKKKIVAELAMRGIEPPPEFVGL